MYSSTSDQHHQLGHPYQYGYHQGGDESRAGSDSWDVPPEVMQPGNNHLKIYYILKQNVERNEMKEMFKDFIVHSSDVEEIACVEVIEIVKKLSSREQEGIINSMVNYFLAAKSHLIPLDRLITKILFALYEQKVMPILPIAYGLIKSLDMKFRITIDPKKVNFVREHLHEIGYKGMRDLLKLALIDKLGSLPHAITDFQRQQLIPVEDLMLDLLDRKSNLCPSLFVITEISRIHTNCRHVYILPRFSLAIRNFVASFRPVAEVGSILCRVWLYPITTSLTYSWFGNTWRVLEAHSRIPVKTHLPYTSEFLSAQTYFEFMVLKQPRGQFNMHKMVKEPYKVAYQCTEMLQVLILEAMKAMEDTKLPINAEINQYNWRHVFHSVSYALCTNHGCFDKLLGYLKCNLDVLKIKKSRDELMWTILQYVALIAGRQPVSPTIITHIFDIFNNLYPEELTWSGNSSDPMCAYNCSRFFASASIWINLGMNKEDHQPPEKILSNVQFLEGAISSKNIGNDDGLLVVMANSYSNQETVFNTEICHPIYKRLHSVGHQQAPYFLPYGLQADGALECLDSQFLEALTFHAKQQLCYHLLYNAQQMMANGKCPSPAIIETISRITLKAEAMNTHGRTFAVFLLNRLKPKEKQEKLDIFKMILYDLMVYRQKNAILSPNNRCLFVSYAYELMPPTGQAIGDKLPLYVLMEQTIIRQFMVAPPYDLLPMIALFARGSFKTHPESSNKFNLLTSQARFFQQPNEPNICPEVGKLLMIYFIIGYKFTADYPSETSLTEFINAMHEAYKWPRCSLQWFPKNIAHNVQPDTSADTQMIAQYEELIEAEHNFLWHSSNETIYMATRPPVIFITILNSLIKYPNMAFPPHTNNFLNTMSLMSLTANINALVIYMILKAKRISSDSEYEQMIRCLYKMIFVDRFLPFERFFLSLILHPNDTDSIRASVVILSSLLTTEEKDEFRSHRGIIKRLHALYNFLPTNSNLLTYNSEEYFKKLLAYRKEYSDYDFERLASGEFPPSTEPQERRGYHSQLPMYYSNIAERILPIVDILFLRCFEVTVDKTVMETFVKAFAPIYRYHPQPVTFLYKLAYVLDGVLPLPKNSIEPSNFTRFVVAVCKKLDEDRTPRYPFLSAEFILHQHQMPATKFCEVLVARIVAATTYIHQPPEFVARDWRIAEFTPAAQALISACLELMSSPKDTKEIVKALIEVSMQRPLKRPYDRLNAVALILTNLPKRFQQNFFAEVADSFEWESLKTNGPDYLFSAYNVEVMQYAEDRIMSVLALMHAFIQHANADTLALLCSVMGEKFAPKVDNETQLIYFLRIITVYLLKISDRDKTNVMSDSSSQYLQLIISIYGMIPRILKEKPKLQYEDMVCDMLYLFKYTVMGYSVNKETEEAIARFPESMQKKLKFLPSHTIRDITSHHINKSIPHCTLIQLFDNNFNNIRDHSDLMPTALMQELATANQIQQQDKVFQIQQQLANQQAQGQGQGPAQGQQPGQMQGQAQSLAPNQPMPVLHPNMPPQSAAQMQQQQATSQSQQMHSQQMPSHQHPQQMAGGPQSHGSHMQGQMGPTSQGMPGIQGQPQPMISQQHQAQMPPASMAQPASGAYPTPPPFSQQPPSHSQQQQAQMMHRQFVASGGTGMHPGQGQGQFHPHSGIPPQMMNNPAAYQQQMMQQQQMAAGHHPHQSQGVGGLPQPPPYFPHAGAQRPQMHGQNPQQAPPQQHDNFQFANQQQQQHFAMQQQMYAQQHGQVQGTHPGIPPQMMQQRPQYMQQQPGAGPQQPGQGQMPPRM